MLMLIKHPEIRDKILAELDTTLIQPYLNSLVNRGKTKDCNVNVLDLINFDNSGDLEYYSNCHSESLRMQPPVFFSSSIMMMRDCQCDYINLRKGDCISFDIFRLHTNPAEWQEPEKFIPDRFDFKSPYFLTPSGKHRNPFSFLPFLGG